MKLDVSLLMNLILLSFGFMGKTSLALECPDTLSVGAGDLISISAELEYLMKHNDPIANHGFVWPEELNQSELIRLGGVLERNLVQRVGLLSELSEDLDKLIDINGNEISKNGRSTADLLVEAIQESGTVITANLKFMGYAAEDDGKLREALISGKNKLDYGKRPGQLRSYLGLKTIFIVKLLEQMDADFKTATDADSLRSLFGSRPTGEDWERQEIESAIESAWLYMASVFAGHEPLHNIDVKAAHNAAVDNGQRFVDTMRTNKEFSEFFNRLTQILSDRDLRAATAALNPQSPLIRDMEFLGEAVRITRDLKIGHIEPRGFTIQRHTVRKFVDKYENYSHMFKAYENGHPELFGKGGYFWILSSGFPLNTYPERYIRIEIEGARNEGPVDILSGMVGKFMRGQYEPFDKALSIVKLAFLSDKNRKADPKFKTDILNQIQAWRRLVNEDIGMDNMGDFSSITDLNKFMNQLEQEIQK